MAGVSQINFNIVPAAVLNTSIRVKLGIYLNHEREMLARETCLRDYRGLAELMGYQYEDILNLGRNSHPTEKLLEEWTKRPGATVGLLMKYLKEMGRYEIVQDLEIMFERDAKLHKQNRENPLQVPEVSSCLTKRTSLDESEMLTTDDVNNRQCTSYDIFVCYAEKNFDFVLKVARYLQSEEIGFKLLIPKRHILAGKSEYETCLRLISERCNRVLIILSPDFLKRPFLEALVNFAGAVGTKRKYRKLVPVMCEPCEKPLLLEHLQCIDFTNNEWGNEEKRQQLVLSLRDVSQPQYQFTSSEIQNQPANNSSFYFESESDDNVYPEISIMQTANSSNTADVGWSNHGHQAAVRQQTFLDSNSSVEVNEVEDNDSFIPLASIITSSNETSGFLSQASDGSCKN